MNAATRALPWLALLAALSPTLLDLGRHMAAEPWSAYALVFAGVWVCWIREGPSVEGRRWALGLIALGIALEILGVASRFPRIGRPGIPLALAGMALALGSFPPRRVWLALWLIPVPSRLLGIASPELESLGLRIATGVVGIWESGIQWSIGGPWEGASVTTPAGSLGLRRHHGGLPLCVLLAGIGWVDAQWRSLRPAAAWRQALLWALPGLPLQWLALTLCVALLAGGVSANPVWLLEWSWLPVATLGLGTVILRRLRRRRSG